MNTEQQYPSEDDRDKAAMPGLHIDHAFDRELEKNSQILKVGMIVLAVVVVLLIVGIGLQHLLASPGSTQAGALSVVMPTPKNGTTSTAAEASVPPARDPSAAAVAPAAAAASDALPDGGVRLPDVGTTAVKDVSFDQYSTAIYEGPIVLPNFAGRQKAFRDYRTRITEGAKQGVNFAGNYHIVTSGCGAGCQMGFVIDERTGTVHDLDYGGEEQMYLNLDAKPDSTLLKATYFDGSNCRDEAATWDGSRFQVITRMTRPEPGPDAGMGMNCSSDN